MQSLEYMIQPHIMPERSSGCCSENQICQIYIAESHRALVGTMESKVSHPCPQLNLMILGAGFNSSSGFHDKLFLGWSGSTKIRLIGLLQVWDERWENLGQNMGKKLSQKSVMGNRYQKRGHKHKQYDTTHFFNTSNMKAPLAGNRWRIGLYFLIAHMLMLFHF